VDPRTLAAVALAVTLRPALWGVAARQAFRLAGRRWWARAPFLPLPPRRYMKFRLVTAYGGDGSAPPSVVARDVVAYLEWCRGFHAGAEVPH
jgi:hypothetical protein